MSTSAYSAEGYAPINVWDPALTSTETCSSKTPSPKLINSNEAISLLKIDTSEDKNLLRSVMDLTNQSLFKDVVALVVLNFGFYMTGIAYYHRKSDFTYLNTIYLAVVTITTVGYGDISPESAQDRLFTSFWILFGFLISATTLSFMVILIVNRHDLKLKKKRRELFEQGKRIQAARQTCSFEHNPVQLKGMDPASTSQLEKPLNVPSKAKQTTSAYLRSIFFGKVITNGCMDSEESIQQENINLEEFIECNRQNYLKLEIDLRLGVICNMLSICFLIFIGVIVFMHLENLSVNDAMYFTIVTVSTVGYGDITPTTDEGKIFSIFYLPTTCLIFLVNVGNIAKYPLYSRALQHEVKIFDQFGAKNGMSEDTLKSIINSTFFDDCSGLRKKSDSISKAEFVLLVLNTMGKINENDVTFVMKLFDKLDLDRSGDLSKDEVEAELNDAKVRDYLRTHDIRHAERATVLHRVERLLQNGCDVIQEVVQGAKATSNRAL